MRILPTDMAIRGCVAHRAAPRPAGRVVWVIRLLLRAGDIGKRLPRPTPYICAGDRIA